VLVALDEHPDSLESPRTRPSLEQLLVLSSSENKPMVFDHLLLAQRLLLEGRKGAWELVQLFQQEATDGALLTAHSADLADDAEAAELSPGDEEHFNLETLPKAKDGGTFETEVLYPHNDHKMSDTRKSKSGDF
jgi:hypothetical protein